MEETKVFGEKGWNSTTGIILPELSNHKNNINNMLYVSPEKLKFNGLWNHFTGRKKYDICCGNCGYQYTDKVKFNIGDEAISICPACDKLNKWSHYECEQFYNRFIKE